MNNEAATSHPDACDKYLSTTIPAWCERHSRILFGLIVLIVLAGFNNQWLIGPDSALHLNIGRNLAAGLGYMHPDGLHKGLNPGLAYMTALGFSLFGPDHLLTSHVINVGLGGIGLALTYWLFRLHCDRGTAILITALLGTNENYYHYLYILLADLPFAVGVLLSLVGYERIQKESPRVWFGVLLISVGIVFMAAFRSVVLLFVVALVLAMLIDLVRAKRIKALAVSILSLAMVILLARLWDPNLSHPFQFSADEQIIYERFTAELPQTLKHVWYTNLPLLLNEVTAETVFALDFGRIASVCLSLAVLGCLFLMAIDRKRALWFILPALLIPQWLAFFVADRYFLPLMPLLIYGWWWAATKLEHLLPRRIGRPTVVVMLVVLVVPNLIRVGRFIQIQRSPDFITAYSHGQYPSAVKLGDWMSRSLDSNALIISNRSHAQILSFLSGRHVSAPWRVQAPLPEEIYLVEPLDIHGRRWLARHPYTIGPALVTIGSEDAPHYTLHRGTMLD